MDTLRPPEAYQFVMDKWLPTTIPMKRLAQYLDKMASLLGSPERVHFVKITEGSARPAFNVEAIAAFEVNQRLAASRDGQSAEGAKLCKDINRMLMEDGCTGYLRALNGPKVIEFLGRKTPISQEVTVHEAGELEGQIIRVGGKDASVPVTLLGADGIYHRCFTSRVIAKDLARLLFGGTVRVEGKGKWRRDGEGKWNLDEFQIMDYTELDDINFENFVKDMRAVPGSAWNEMEYPQEEFRRLRED